MTEQTKKLFLSIPIERHFRRVFDRYRDVNGRRVSYVRWTPERNMHVTVLFIGEVTVSKVPALVECLADALIPIDPFALRLQKVSYAPPGRQADMVWAYWEPSNTLDAASHAAYRAVCDAGLVPQDSFKNGVEPLIGHIMLGRFKKGAVVQTLIELPRTELEGHDMLVEDVELMESRPTPNGSEYSVLETFSLHPPDAAYDEDEEF